MNNESSALPVCSRLSLIVEMVFVVAAIVFFFMLNGLIAEMEPTLLNKDSDLSTAFTIMSYGGGVAWGYLMAGFALALCSFLPVGMIALDMKLSYTNGRDVSRALVLLGCVLILNLALLVLVIDTLSMPVLWADVLVTGAAMAACCISS